ncbi:hypothetical protein MKX03_018285, partial [Papaver bracteatum]
MNVHESSKIAILVGITGLGCVGIYYSSRPTANETAEDRAKRERRTCYALLCTGLLVGTAAVLLKKPQVASAVAAKSQEAGLSQDTLEAGVTAPATSSYQLPPSGSRERWYYDNFAEQALRLG